MNNIFSNKLSLIFFGCIIVAFCITALSISFSNRIEGDAAFHALVSREIAQKGHIINSTSYIMANEVNNFPIAYPEIFHVIGALGFLYMGTSAFFLLPVLYGSFSLYFLIVILASLHKNIAAVIVGILALALNVYFLDYSSKYFMEIGLVFAILAALAYTMRYLTSKNMKYLYIAAIFFGLSVAIKQQGLIALPVFLVTLLVSFVWNKSPKPILVSLLLFFVISAGPMVQLFYSTGSILYAGDNPPKVIQMFESPLRKQLGIQLLEGDKQWSTINEGRREEELVTWRTIANTVTAWTVQESSASVPWIQLTGILFIIITVRIIKTKSVTDLIMLIFLVLFYFLLYYLARPRYALPLIILPSVTLFYIVYSLKIFKTKPSLILSVIALFLIYTMINFGNKLTDIAFRDDFGFYGRYNQQRDVQLQKLYASILTDPNHAYTILSPVPYETAYYTKQPTLWANPYGGTDLFKSFLGAPEHEVVSLLKKYHVKYLIIYSDRFMKFTNWAGISPNDGFFSNIDNSNNFRLIQRNESGRVYVFNYQ